MNPSGMQSYLGRRACSLLWQYSTAGGLSLLTGQEACLPSSAGMSTGYSFLRGKFHPKMRTTKSRLWDGIERLKVEALRVNLYRQDASDESSDLAYPLHIGTCRAIASLRNFLMPCRFTLILITS